MERLWNMSIVAAMCCNNENNYLKSVSHFSCEADNQFRKLTESDSQPYLSVGHASLGTIIFK